MVPHAGRSAATKISNEALRQAQDLRQASRYLPEGKKLTPRSRSAVAVHPLDPNTAWFAPAIKDELRIPKDGELVITRTRDGGASFDILRNGLPQEPAYDLVYRHALAVDSTGERLAFGSTTGSVWTSEDQGERWTQITAHLPPVYSVSFVDL